jgi:peptidoglycan/xylan/chitin deacetylase (PgdA/CDA1 family)
MAGRWLEREAAVKWRWLCGMGWVVACGAEPAEGVLGTRPLALGSDEPSVTVSLTFDDTLKPQLAGAAVLEAYGLRGTFYVNAPRLHAASAGSDSDYMSVADALELAARGHDLGGHTLSHPSLTTLPEAERAREIENDRRELLRLGLPAQAFAYPGGDVEDLDPELGRPLTLQSADAGYASGRDTNGFRLDACDTGPERLPPEDTQRIRSVRSVNNAPPVREGEDPAPPDTAATLLDWMDHAARCGGGWLPLIFHHLREDCAAEPGLDYCFDLAELDALSAALAEGRRCAGSSCYRIVAETVSEALGVTPEEPAGEVAALRNPSFERMLASGRTECSQLAQRSEGTAVSGRSTRFAHSGAASERLEIAEPFVAPAELRITRDFGACAQFTTEGQAYELALHYLADPELALPALRLVVHRLDVDYVWQQWVSGTTLEARDAGEWVRRSFITPPVPEGTLALSFGLRLESAGVVYLDDLEIAPAPAND